MGNETATARDVYLRAIDYDRPLGLDRPFVLTPAAARQEKASLNHKWSAFGPFLLADEYTHWYDEALQLRETATIGDWSPLAKYIISGPDSHRFSDYICTRDLSELEIGQCMYTPMTNEQGRLVGDNLVVRLDENRYRWTTDTMTKWLAHARELGGLDVSIDDVRSETCLYSLQGPKCLEIMERLTGRSWSDVKFSRLMTTEIEGFEVEVLRQGFTGEQGYELSSSVENAVALWDAIVTAGEGFGMGYLGNYTSRMTRVEAGLSLLHFDYHPAHDDVPGFQRHAQMDPTEHQCSPYELNLGHFVHLDSAPFIGQEALAAEAADGTSRWDFVGLVWEPEDVIASFAALFDEAPAPAPLRLPHVLAPLAVPLTRDDAAAGWATSVSYSPSFRRVISFARVPRGEGAPGTQYVAVWGAENGPQHAIRTEVVELPFVEWKRAAE